jgi:hypothetical protein
MDGLHWFGIWGGALFGLMKIEEEEECKSLPEGPFRYGTVSYEFFQIWMHIS